MTSPTERGLFEQLDPLLNLHHDSPVVEKIKAICADYEQRLAEAKKDVERMEWLEEQFTLAAYPPDVGESFHLWPGKGTVRAQIDAVLTAPLPEKNDE